MSVAQAAAAGTMVISSDCVPFSVHDAADTCLLFRTGDVRDLEGALRRALTDEHERRSRTQALAERVRTLNWREKSEEFIEFLRRSGIPVAPAEARA